jgi:hypothetical protein
VWFETKSYSWRISYRDKEPESYSWTKSDKEPLTKSYSWRMARPRTHKVERGKGVPKEREMNRRREIHEWEG